MLRKLVSKYGKRSKGKSRRGGRKLGYGAALAVECLEERVVLSTSTPVLNVMPDSVGAVGTGQTQLYLARFTDVVDVPFTFSSYNYTINWGDGSALDSGTVTATPATIDIAGTVTEGRIQGHHAYTAAGDYTVTVSLTEIGGTGTVTDSMVMSIYDQYDVEPGESQFQFGYVAPADEFGNALPTPENTPVTFSFQLPPSVDPADVDGWTVSWGDETVFYNGTPSSITHVYPNAFTHLISEPNIDGSSTFFTKHYIYGAVHLSGDNPGTYGMLGAIHDLLFDPTTNDAVSISGPATVAKDATYTLDLSYTDAPEDYAVAWIIVWGDGQFETFVGDPSSVSHTYTTEGTYEVNAIARMNEGLSFSQLTSVVVGVLPTPEAGGPYTTFADNPITLTGSVDDPTGLTFIWDLDGDDVFGETGEVGESVTFDPAGVAGTHTVRLKVTDGVTESEAAEATIDVLADGALVLDNELVVVGDAVEGDTVLVSLDGTTVSVETAAGTTTFDTSNFGDIRIRTGAGNDVVVIDSSITNTVYIDGGDGNDLLVGGGGRSIFNGGAGSDFLYGAAGDDILMGGEGNDQIFGGGGNDSIAGGEGVDIVSGGSGFDLLIGGQDSDLIAGGGGEDILVGGWTIHDGDAAALDLIMATWTNGNSFDSRISELTGAGGLLQAGSAVFDDDDLDILIGGGGRDLVFGDTNPFDGAFDLIALSLAQDRLIAVN